MMFIRNILDKDVALACPMPGTPKPTTALFYQEAWTL